MKKKITKPEMKLLKLQKMNVIATSGNINYPTSFGAKGLNNGGKWHDDNPVKQAGI